VFTSVRIGTLNQLMSSRDHHPLFIRRAAWLSLSVCILLGVIGSACRKDVAADATDSDANGYLCLQCGAKLYTPRSVFIGPKCPKCQGNELVEVVGYLCPKDRHKTLRPRSGSREPLECELCKGPVGGMFLPRETDLKAWGAQKTS